MDIAYLQIPNYDTILRVIVNLLPLNSSPQKVEYRSKEQIYIYYMR